MRQPTDTIVVAVDGSTSATNALDWAIDQAVAERRPLTLVHALGNPTPAWTDLAIANPQAAYAALQRAGQDILDEARDRVSRRAPEVEVHERLEFREPRELLLEESKEAAVLVLGSRGRGSIRSLLLGSVGVAVTRHASCPVVVHRPSNRGEVRHGVLVACDASEESRAVLEFAYRQAELRDLPLTVMHCFWELQAIGGAAYDALPVDDQSERLELAEAVAGMSEKYPGVRVTTQLAHGVPQVRVAIASEHMDLVVVGVHHRSRAQRVALGSVSVAVLEHSACPVAVVPVTSSAAASTA